MSKTATAEAEAEEQDRLRVFRVIYSMALFSPLLVQDSTCSERGYNAEHPTEGDRGVGPYDSTETMGIGGITIEIHA